MDPKVHNNLGIICGLTKRNSERMSLFKRSIEIDPSFAEGHLNYGVALHDEGMADAAIAQYKQAISLRMDFKAAYLTISKSFIQVDAGMSALEMLASLSLDATNTEALFQFGLAFIELNRFNQAIEAFEAILKHEPNHLQASRSIGLILQEQGRHAEAALIFSYLLASNPDEAGLYLHLGASLELLGDYEQAEKYLSSALALNPQDSVAMNCMGLCCTNQLRLEEAIDWYHRSLATNSDNPSALTNLALAMRNQGNIENAISLFKKALMHQPHKKEPTQGLLFSYSICGNRYEAEMLATSTDYWTHIRSTSITKKPGRHIPLTRTSSERIRIGILSGDIGFHCVSSFIDSYLSFFDRSKFEVDLLLTSTRSDLRTESITKKASSTHSLHSLSMDKSRLLLENQNYDLIIDTSGHTSGTALELLAHQCAPLQCHYIGYHATTGLDTINFFIGDEETADSSFQPFFTEELWRLKRPWLACIPYTAPPTAKSTNTIEGPVFGCFSQLAKIREETLTYWASAMLRVTSASLLIKDRNTDIANARERILNSLGEKGIDPSRIHFLPWSWKWEDHLESYNQIDIALDTTPWSSATTAFDALSMGVPLIAIRGKCMAARMSSSIVKGLAKPDWIAETPHQFGCIVEQLSDDWKLLRENKKHLQTEVLSSCLFDARDLANHLDNAIIEMNSYRIKI